MQFKGDTRPSVQDRITAFAPDGYSTHHVIDRPRAGNRSEFVVPARRFLAPMTYSPRLPKVAAATAINQGKRVVRLKTVVFDSEKLRISLNDDGTGRDARGMAIGLELLPLATHAREPEGAELELVAETAEHATFIAAGT
jgi:hypothetical protein